MQNTKHRSININVHKSSQVLQKLAFFVLAGFILTGCQSTSVFYWGQYESLVYKSYVDPDNATAPIQIKALQKDITKAEQNNVQIAPGIFAQLGYMYVIAGDKEQAKKAFMKEKDLFPESSHFMDTLIQKLPKQSKEITNTPPSVHNTPTAHDRNTNKDKEL